MIRLEMKNGNMILNEKQRKYQLNHLEKLINMNMLQVKKYYLLIISYFSFRKSFRKTIEEQGKKQVEALEVLKPNTQKINKDAIPENALSEEAKNELNKINEIKRTVDGKIYFIKQMNKHIVLKIFEQ